MYTVSHKKNIYFIFFDCVYFLLLLTLGLWFLDFDDYGTELHLLDSIIAVFYAFLVKLTAKSPQISGNFGKDTFSFACHC